jgi:sugar O-acyltransferase (sialic acid O-acetyltransferase NeuD family)
VEPNVIYGVGSPLVVDAEETCARLGIRVAAAVRNIEGESHVVSAIPVVEADEATEELRRLPLVVPLFTPGFRRSALEDAHRRGFASAATIVDPTSAVASSTTLGEGVYVNAGVTIGGAGRLGDHVLVNRGASLGHHIRLDALASVGPGAVLAGNVTMGRGAVVGAGAVVLPGVDIGDNAVVGGGAVVTRDVRANTVVVGNPARVTRADVAGFNDVGV